MDNSLPPSKSFPEKKMCFPGITTFYIIYRVSLLRLEYSDGGLYYKLLWMCSSTPESISTLTAHVVGYLIFEGLRFLLQQINDAKISIIFAVIPTCASINFSLQVSLP